MGEHLITEFSTISLESLIVPYSFLGCCIPPAPNPVFVSIFLSQIVNTPVRLYPKQTTTHTLINTPISTDWIQVCTLCWLSYPQTYVSSSGDATRKSLRSWRLRRLWRVRKRALGHTRARPTSFGHRYLATSRIHQENREPENWIVGNSSNKLEAKMTGATRCTCLSKSFGALALEAGAGRAGGEVSQAIWT